MYVWLGIVTHVHADDGKMLGLGSAANMCVLRVFVCRCFVQVNPEELGGKRAELLLPTLRQHVASVRKRFVLLEQGASS